MYKDTGNYNERCTWNVYQSSLNGDRLFLVLYCILHFISRQLDHSHDLWIDVPLKLLGICLEEVLLVVVVTVD